MNTYIQQCSLITVDNLALFAADNGWEDDDIEEALASWDLFGDGRASHAEFERNATSRIDDESLRAIFSHFFSLHPELQSIVVVR